MFLWFLVFLLLQPELAAAKTCFKRQAFGLKNVICFLRSEDHPEGFCGSGNWLNKC